MVPQQCLSCGLRFRDIDSDFSSTIVLIQRSLVLCVSLVLLAARWPQ